MLVIKAALIAYHAAGHLAHLAIVMLLIVLRSLGQLQSLPQHFPSSASW